MRDTDDHIKKIADLKKVMRKKIPVLIQEIQEALAHPSASHLSYQSYMVKCREVLNKLNVLKKILPHLDSERADHYQIIVQIALYLINNASINLVFSRDDRQSILKEKHWATVGDFGKFIYPTVYRPDIVEKLLNPQSAKSLDF